VSPPRRPDFFIVGAPKCGTTALYSYLRSHPGLFLPARKELRYFGSDLEIRDRVPLTEEAYLAHFATAPVGSLVGSAYVWYLFSQSAAGELRAFAPEARIIAMVRNPVDMVPALHAEHLSNGNEDIGHLNAALDAEPDRRAGRRIPAHAHLPQGLWYSQVPRYSDQLQRYLAAFGPERVHVVVFDDFVSDTAAAYAAVLRFLEVDEGVQPPAFEVVNPNRRLRSERLRHFLARPPDRLRRAIGRTVPAAIRRGLYERAKGWNLRATPRAAIPAEVAERLRLMFADEVASLSALLGRDLGHWSAPRVDGGQADGPAPGA
jgi:hypothetical protein